MPIARSATVDHLPGNRAVAAVRGEEGTLFLIAKDRPAEEIAAELTDLMQEGIDSGQWTLNWSDPVPLQLQRVS